MALRSNGSGETERTPAPRQQPVRCLVVDDEPHLRRLLGRLMRSEGFLVEEAENGRVAQEVLAKQPATLLLSDLHMPEVDGRELLRRGTRPPFPRPLPR